MSNSLVPLSVIKDILKTVTEDNILSYEGNICTQQGMIPGSDQELSILELKVVFKTATTEESSNQ